MGHPLVRLAHQIDWGFLEERFAAVCTTGSGQPPLPARLIAGLFILKHTHSLSDEVLCARWLENPYYQHFCGEQVFRHELPFDRSSLTRWRQRLGEEHLAALLQESLSVAHKTGALETKDLERVAVDTTVQPKAVVSKTECSPALPLSPGVLRGTAEDKESFASFWHQSRLQERGRVLGGLLDGEVELETSGMSMRSLSAGEAVVVHASTARTTFA